MAEPTDWVLVAAALVATAVAVLPRSGHQGGRMVQVMGFLLLSALVSLIWLRLSSVDVALAEASLGGGLLGAVLVFIAAAPREAEAPSPRRRALSTPAAWAAPLLGTLAGAVLVVVLSAVWLRVQQTMPAWSEPLEAQLPIGGEPGGGVTHGVTAVLLAFRAYDTLLESAVLMMAAVAALALRREASRAAVGPTGEAATEVSGAVAMPPVLSAQTTGLVWLVRVSAPVLLLAGLWLLFAGSTDSGGAFQSAAVLSALLILLRVAGLAPRWLTAAQGGALRLALVVGVAVFVLAGLLGPIAGQPWLSWDAGWAFAVILTVEILLTVGLTAGLYAIYLSLEEASGVRRR